MASRAPLRMLGAGRSTRRSRLGAPALCPEPATGPAPLLAKAVSARVHPRVVITASARAFKRTPYRNAFLCHIGSRYAAFNGMPVAHTLA